MLIPVVLLLSTSPVVGRSHSTLVFIPIYLLFILQDLCQQPLGCSCPSLNAPGGIVICPHPALLILICFISF